MNIQFRFLPLSNPFISECTDGKSRLVNASVGTMINDNGTVVNTVTGLIEVCYNGTWLTVCYDDPDQFTEGNRRAVNYTCQDMGYDGMSAAAIQGENTPLFMAPPTF